MAEQESFGSSANPIKAQETVDRLDSPLEAKAKQAADLPSEVKEQLPEHAQQIFMAAFKGAQDDGMSEEAAKQVGWNSVKQEYEQGEGGKWQRKQEDTNIHNKAIPSGGN